MTADKFQILHEFPEWLKALAAFITSIGSIIAVKFGLKKKRKASNSSHAASFRNAESRDRKVDEIINTMVAAIPNCVEIGIAQWRNGDMPKEYRILRSTNFNTWSVWKEYQIAEPDLVKIQAATLDEDYCLFRSTQLKDTITQEWYAANHIKQTTSILIGVNDLKNESLVAYINYKEEHIVAAETRKLIRLYIRQLSKAYEPLGWFAKKNYLTN